MKQKMISLNQNTKQVVLNNLNKHGSGVAIEATKLDRKSSWDELTIKVGKRIKSWDQIYYNSPKFKKDLIEK